MDKKDIRAALKRMGQEYDKIYFVDEFKKKMGYGYHDEFSVTAFCIQRLKFWRLSNWRPIQKSPLYVIELNGKYALHSINNEQHGEWMDL